ncbi:MAG: 1-acyl-sn-glycerol-3-phosphate acyltransferase [Pirellulales bacterium]|nr:1-acyl-sn-glycerol-3-phosphate acyltransferase [Pirellulales bacterium]
MHKVVFEKPYQFIAPSHATIWSTLAKLYVHRYLRKTYKIHSIECRNTQRLKASIDAGHGILLAPNHSRLSDPFVLGEVAIQLKICYYAMVSWHAFQQSWFDSFTIRKLGGFSVYREGPDRRAIAMAIDILTAARRPLVVFPEGALSRHNDQLMALMDGISFIAQNAARRRAKQNPPGKVVIHPAAIRYYFRGNLEESLAPVLDELESHFAWRPKRGLPWIKRIRAIGEACLALKEIEYTNHARGGDLYDRLEDLIEHLLSPLEEEYQIINKALNIVGRVKDLRTAILPDMIHGAISDAERERRWQQLAACYYAQQMSHYPRGYIQSNDNIPEHVIETVERLQEDLTDHVRPHGPLHAVVQIGEAIQVHGKRDRMAKTDPIMDAIACQLTAMLAQLAAESPRISPEE